MWWFRRRQPPKATDDWEQQSDQIAAARESRKSMVAGRESVVDQLEGLLFRHDPIGINFEFNTDEYRSEAETITIRLPEAHSVEDVLRITHEEFIRWFDDTAGPVTRYEAIAAEVWEVWSASDFSAGGTDG